MNELPDPDPCTLAEARRVVAWFQTQRWTRRCRPHPAFPAYVHLLFWAGGLRPSEASGLQWQDIDLRRGLLYVRRSYNLGVYDKPKYPGAKRTVELLPETVRILRALQSLHVTPEQPLFTCTTGTPIEPMSFTKYWHDSLRACGIRQRGLYSTKDTFATEGWRTMGIDWVSAQTGVSIATLKQHYAKWKPDPNGEAMRRWTAVYEGSDGEDADTDVAPNAENIQQYHVQSGGFIPV
jgi:integrase